MVWVGVIAAEKQFFDVDVHLAHEIISSDFIPVPHLQLERVVVGELGGQLKDLVKVGLYIVVERIRSPILGVQCIVLLKRLTLFCF